MTQQSARPRDALGRPLPWDASAPVPPVPEREQIDGAQAWSEAMDYLDRGLPFHVHEVLEQRWRCAPDAERPAWRAAAQWGAALTHAARGNAIGARRLAERAAEGLRSAPMLPDAVDADFIESSCAQMLERSI